MAEVERQVAAGNGVSKKVLVVEDSPTISMLCAEHLRQNGFEVTVVETGQDCLAYLENSAPAAMLLDLGLPDMDGIDILKWIRERDLPTSVVIITSNASLKSAVEAMRLGAFDYVVKPFNGERISTTVRNAVATFSLSEEVKVYRKQAVRPNYAGLIGASPQMQAVYRIIESAATSRATVFITGESGTGKELCASAVHTQSRRAEGPFVAINCAAIPHALMESEIFGHVKGAFTNATSDRQGAAMRANGGTLFLDEICEMDLDLQAKILRLTQSGTFERVGGSRTESVDIRIVCATNRDPWAEVQAGRFREDLFYRLHVIPLHIPPLRERSGDVVTLAETFLAKFAQQEDCGFTGIGEEAAALINGYSWPGNVRELENAIHNSVVLNVGELLTAEMLPERIRSNAVAEQHLGQRVIGRPSVATPLSAPNSFAPLVPGDEIQPLSEVERIAIQHALKLCDGNVPLAAAKLGVGVSTIYRKKSEWTKQ